MDATKLEETVTEKVNDLADQIQPKIAEAKRRLGELDNGFRTLVKEHPAACLLGAVALGYFIARLARRAG